MLMVKNVGKPYEGEPHVRFDEGKVGKPTDPLYNGTKWNEESFALTFKILRLRYASLRMTFGGNTLRSG
jgi:hypothetical protein